MIMVYMMVMGQTGTSSCLVIRLRAVLLTSNMVEILKF